MAFGLMNQFLSRKNNPMKKTAARSVLASVLLLCGCDPPKHTYQAWIAATGKTNVTYEQFVDLYQHDCLPGQNKPETIFIPVYIPSH